MSLRIGGMGWVTPLGSDVSEVWQRLVNGDAATLTTISDDPRRPSYPVFRVPADVTAKAPAHPRLRRSSAISRFAAIAGLSALDDAGLKLDAEAAERTALIFAISNGGAIYTKRFYHDIVASGAQAASPLLFPETVFNAPASHLAAILSLTGATYTLVGDGAVGILALKMAEDLMQNESLDRCLVVGAEEADWLLCDAYHRWRLLRSAAPLEPFAMPPRGTVLSEGAGALVIDRTGETVLEKIDAGSNFRRQTEAAACVSQVFQNLRATNEDIIIASANGTFVDHAEKAAALRSCPHAKIYAPKGALGESVGAGSIWQVICAAQTLRTRTLPPALHVAADCSLTISRSMHPELEVQRAIVSACGMNQQVAGLSLSLVG